MNRLPEPEIPSEEAIDEVYKRAESRAKPRRRKTFADVAGQDRHVLALLDDIKDGQYAFGVRQVSDDLFMKHRAAMTYVRDLEEDFSSTQISKVSLRVQHTRSDVASVKSDVISLCGSLDARLQYLEKYLAETYKTEIARDAKTKAERDAKIGNLLRGPHRQRRNLLEFLRFCDVLLDDLDKMTRTIKNVIDAMNQGYRERY